MSFWIFFVLLIIVTIDLPICFGANCEFIGFKELFSIRNSIAFASILLLLSGIFFYYEFMKDLEGDLRQPVTIENIENVNYEYFALLVTIISLVALSSPLLSIFGVLFFWAGTLPLMHFGLPQLKKLLDRFSMKAAQVNTFFVIFLSALVLFARYPHVIEEIAKHCH